MCRLTSRVAVALAITVPLLGVIAAPSSAVTASLTITGFINGIPADRVTTGSVSPAFVDLAEIPADGVQVVVNDVITIHAPLEPGQPCISTDTDPVTGPFPVWSAFKAPGPFTQPHQPELFVGPFVTGAGATETREVDNLCRASTVDGITRVDWNFTITAETLATLSTGCYQFLPENIDTALTGSISGFPPALEVGLQGVCNRTGNLTLTGTSQFSGAAAGLIYDLLGTETATVTATPAEAVNAIKQLCIQDVWTATIKKFDPSTIPLFWGDATNHYPFEDPEWFLITKTPPNMKGLIKGQYFEQVSHTRCTLPFSGQTSLTVPVPAFIVGSSPFVSVTHRATMFVTGPQDQLLGSIAFPTVSSKKSGIVVNQSAEPITISVPML
jgi:hypothetical protein